MRSVSDSRCAAVKVVMVVDTRLGFVIAKHVSVLPDPIRAERHVIDVFPSITMHSSGFHRNSLTMHSVATDWLHNALFLLLHAIPNSFNHAASLSSS